MPPFAIKLPLPAVEGGLSQFIAASFARVMRPSKVTYGEPPQLKKPLCEVGVSWSPVPPSVKSCARTVW